MYGIQSYIYLLNFIFEHNPRFNSGKFKNQLLKIIQIECYWQITVLQQLNIIDDNKYKGKLSSVSKLLNNCITSMGIRRFKYNILHPTINKE